MKFTRSEPRPARRLRGSLDGPSRTITVEPVETPAPEIRPQREPDRPSKPPHPPVPAR
jgi:hypothetical protein